MADKVKVAMVSGANRGIGLAIARELAGQGYALSLGLRQPESLPPDVAAAGGGALVQPYDAAERGAEQRWVDATIGRFERIDVLVNNAGLRGYVGLDDGSDEALDEMFEVNVKAPFRLIRAALPYLKVSGQGRVINLASLSGKRVLGLNAGYQMAKHAVVALNHATRRYGWEHGIRATAVCPGFVDTGTVGHQPELPREEITKPEDLARLVADILRLPNTASVAELHVNWRYEPNF